MAHMCGERFSIDDWEVGERSLRRLVWFRGTLVAGVSHCLEVKFEISRPPDSGSLQAFIRLTPTLLCIRTQSVRLTAVGSLGWESYAKCIGWTYFNGKDFFIHLLKEDEIIQLMRLLVNQEFVTFRINCIKTKKRIGEIPFPNPGGIKSIPCFFPNILNNF